MHLLEQGNEVEAKARKLFPHAIQITSTEDSAVEDTKKLMTTKTPTIFQATFFVDGFIAKNDMLSYDSTNGKWDLCEVKGTNAIKEDSAGNRDHIDDLAFQLSVLKRAGVSVGKCSIIHLNKEYIQR